MMYLSFYQRSASALSVFVRIRRGGQVFMLACLMMTPCAGDTLRAETMFELIRDQPDIDGVSREEAHDHRKRHGSPEDQFGWLHGAHVAAHHQHHHGRNHTSH